jgi:hypothetical protein
MDSRQKRRFVKQSCWLLFACFTSTSASFGQEVLRLDAPNIEILKLKWDREVRLPRNFDPSVIPRIQQLLKALLMSTKGVSL